MTTTQHERTETVTAADFVARNMAAMIERGEATAIDEFGNTITKILPDEYIVYTDEDHDWISADSDYKFTVTYLQPEAAPGDAKPDGGEFALLDEVAKHDDKMDSWLTRKAYTDSNYSALVFDGFVHHYDVAEFYRHADYVYIQLTAKGWKRWHELQVAQLTAEVEQLKKPLSATVGKDYGIEEMPIVDLITSYREQTRFLSDGISHTGNIFCDIIELQASQVAQLTGQLEKAAKLAITLEGIALNAPLISPQQFDQWRNYAIADSYYTVGKLAVAALANWQAANEEAKPE